MAAFRPIAFVRGAFQSAPWVVIAVVFHAVVLTAMGIVYLGRGEPAEVAQDSSIRVTRRAPKPVEEVVQPAEVVVRSTIPDNVDAEVVELGRDIYVPADEDQPRDFTQELGDPNSVDNLLESVRSSTSVGVGKNRGQRGSGVTSTFTGRGSGLESHVPQGQGSGRERQATEKGVLEGLRWLLRHQREDGSWSAKDLRERCKCDDPCVAVDARYGDECDVGLTGLALLAFLGAGYGNDAKQTIVDTVMAREHRVGEAVKRGLLWLKSRQREDGSFEERRVFMYDQALAAMALTENYGLTRNRFWKEPAQKALDFICAAQKPSPSGEGAWGWRYAPRQEIEPGASDEDYETALFDADTSVTTWCVMALKSGEICGLDVPRESLDGALAFVESVTDAAGSGLVGYVDRAGAGLEIEGPGYERFAYHTATMSALGILCRTFVRRDTDDPFFDPAIQRLVADLPSVEPARGSANSPAKSKVAIDYYYWYYGSLALIQLDGPDSPRRTGRYWSAWEKAMRGSLLELQDTRETSCQRGGWMDPDRWSRTGGPVYATAINVLTLEVYYRFGNAFGTKVEMAEREERETRAEPEPPPTEPEPPKIVRIAVREP